MFVLWALHSYALLLADRKPSSHLQPEPVRAGIDFCSASYHIICCKELQSPQNKLY